MSKTVCNLVRRSLSSAQTQPIPADFSSLNIRKTFLDFFCQDHGHTFVRSSPVMPFCDPTLAFVNAGMNQFKNVFLGTDKPPASRAANSQKCIRVGGKHNDLSQVGEDETHHTFFEMLGNWSFGDYFKKEACEMSWELLTKVYGLDPNRLYVSYFLGDRNLNLESDLETREVWRAIGVPDNHILQFGAKENFWEMGLVGPCGPCTEIHYDLIPDRRNAGHLVNVDGSNVTELWNLVFMQYNRKSDGTLEKLKTHHVDTGMGFERLVSVLQNKTSNYDTDLFLPLIKAIEKISKQREYRGSRDEIDVGYRILADHTRMATIALADGFLPDQQAKLKDILRRSFNISENIFKKNKGLMVELTNHVAEILAPAFPEIGRNLSKVQHILQYEEDYFRESKRTVLNDWNKILKENENLKKIDIMRSPETIRGYALIKKSVLNRGLKDINNDIGFKLLDGCGMEVDAVEELASILGLKFDRASLENHAASIRNKGKESQHSELLKKSNLQSSIIQEISNLRINPTIDYFKYEYSVDDAGNFIFKPQSSSILAIINDGKFVNSINVSEIGDREIGLILDRTNFYSEAGGQESDSGKFTIEENVIFNIKTVKNIGGCVVHFGKFENSTESVSINNLGLLELNADKRVKIMRNHTALHLLNAAVNNVLSVTAQLSSTVTPDKLSLTISTYRDNVQAQEVEKMEEIVRNVIKHGVAVRRRTFLRNQLEKLDPITLTPGEFFPEPEVNVIEVNSGYFLSREPCPGTHVLNTAELGEFAIITSSFLKQGKRLIEAVTGEAAVEIRRSNLKYDENLKELRKLILGKGKIETKKAEELQKELNLLLNDVKSNKGLSDWKRKVMLVEIEEIKKSLKMAARVEIIQNFKKLVKEAEGKFVVHVHYDIPKFIDVDFHTIATQCKDKAVLLFLREGGTVTVTASVPEGLQSKEFSEILWLEPIEKLLNKTIGGSVAGKTFGFNYIRSAVWNEEKVKESARIAQELAEKNFKS